MNNRCYQLCICEHRRSGSQLSSHTPCLLLPASPCWWRYSVSTQMFPLVLISCNDLCPLWPWKRAKPGTTLAAVLYGWDLLLLLSWLARYCNLFLHSNFGIFHCHSDRVDSKNVFDQSQRRFVTVLVQSQSTDNNKDNSSGSESNWMMLVGRMLTTIMTWENEAADDNQDEERRLHLKPTSLTVHCQFLLMDNFGHNRQQLTTDSKARSFMV